VLGCLKASLFYSNSDKMAPYKYAACLTSLTDSIIEAQTCSNKNISEMKSCVLFFSKFRVYNEVSVFRTSFFAAAAALKMNN
jgi:hypothetical protein